MNYQEYAEYREKFVEMVDEKRLTELKNILADLNVVDTAEIIEDMEDTYLLICFRMLAKEKGAEVFSFMEPYDQKRIINKINNSELEEILDELDFDDMIDILEEMPANVVTKVLQKSTPEERTEINKFLMYDKNSAGSIMTIEYVSLKRDWTVAEALDHIKEFGKDKEIIYTCYVESEYKQLLGFVSLRTLVVTDKDALINDIMETDLVYFSTSDDKEEVAQAFTRYGYIAIPVVDREHRLCGIITFDDVMDIVEDEATEDIHKMAAINPSEDEYLDQTPWQLAKNRIPWLLILMISATLTSGIITKYNFILSQFLILSSFIPMITDTGGNSGSQSSTVVIRAIATGEIGLRDGVAVIFKEFRVGVICGVVLSAVNFLRLLIFTQADIKISFLVSLTILCTVILSKLMGAILPLFAERINLDPAIMASALITTIIDSVVLVIYFGLASIILAI